MITVQKSGVQRLFDHPVLHFKEIMFDTNSRENINTLCGQNTEFLNVTVDGTYTAHCGLEG
jgi:hypothetical protein